MTIGDLYGNKRNIPDEEMATLVAWYGW